MDKVADVKQTNLKPVPKFNIGHFPPGTIVTVESNFMRYLEDEAEREYEGQMYELVPNLKVLSVSSNGPDSYLIELDIPTLSPVMSGNYVTNMSWVRSIQKRGQDSCSPVPYVDTGELISSLVFREDTSGMHSYDYEAIRALVYKAKRLAPLSKKKIREIVKRAMPHHRIPLKVLVKQEREFWDSMYREESSLDW